VKTGLRPLTDYTAVRPQSTIKSSASKSINLPILQSANIQAGIGLHREQLSELTMSRLDSGEPSHTSRRTQDTHSERRNSKMLKHTCTLAHKTEPRKCRWQQQPTLRLTAPAVKTRPLNYAAKQTLTRQCCRLHGQTTVRHDKHATYAGPQYTHETSLYIPVSSLFLSSGFLIPYHLLVRIFTPYCPAHSYRHLYLLAVLFSSK